MDLEKTIVNQTKMLIAGKSYKDLRSDLLLKYEPEKALLIATNSFGNFRKIKQRNMFKYLALNLVILGIIYFVAPNTHPYKFKISLILVVGMILKGIYDWYMLRELNKEYNESKTNS